MSEATMAKATVIHVNDMRDGDVYVGRTNPRRGLRGTIYGNPFKHGMKWADAVAILSDLPAGTPGKIDIPPVLDREAAVACYRFWIERNPGIVERARRELAGKRLACWCHPKACHADVLAELVNGEGL